MTTSTSPHTTTPTWATPADSTVSGDVVINFTATGEPGAHVIDLYPGSIRGRRPEPQQLYRLPQLTYADDHPGNKIPAIRILFEITPVPPRRAISSR